MGSLIITKAEFHLESKKPESLICSRRIPVRMFGFFFSFFFFLEYIKLWLWCFTKNYLFKHMSAPLIIKQLNAISMAGFMFMFIIKFGAMWSPEVLVFAFNVSVSMSNCCKGGLYKCQMTTMTSYPPLYSC